MDYLIPCRGLVEARRITTLGDAVTVIDDEVDDYEFVNYGQMQQDALNPGEYLIFIPVAKGQ